MSNTSDNVLIDTLYSAPSLPMDYNKVFWMFSSHHDQDCCEWHEIDFSSTPNEFETASQFLTKVDRIDISWVDGMGLNFRMYDGDKEFCIFCPWRGSNNGYYGSNITLIFDFNGSVTEYNVSSYQSYDY